MTIGVKRINSKTVNTRRGPVPVYSVFGEDGVWYSMGFKKPAFDEGDKIDVMAESGSYGMEIKAVTSITKGDGSTVKPAAPSGGGRFDRPRSTFPIHPTDGQRSIIRQNAVTNAREIVNTFCTSGGIVPLADIDSYTDEVIRIARRIESYTAGDIEAAKMKAAMSVEKEADE